MLKYSIVDISERKSHFDYFMSLSNPHAEITVDVDMSKVVRFCAKNGYPFFLTCLHIFAKAAGNVPELRRRIHILSNDEGDNNISRYEVREYETAPTSHTESSSENTYCYCTIHHDMPFSEYITKAKIAQMNARNKNSIEEDNDSEGYLFASCLPWFHYKALSNPTNGAIDTNPRISWGKYDEDYKGRLMMPVTLTVHHALVDGIHIAKFYDNIQKTISEMIV